MRACQQWRDRGIPRYIQSLTFQLHQDNPALDFYFLYERDHPYPLRHEELTDIGTVVFEDTFLSTLGQRNIDFFLITWFFIPPQKRSASEFLFPSCLIGHDTKFLGLVYDFIPIIYPDIYLQDANHYRQYQQCLAAMKLCAHIFGISDCTRDDAIRLAGLDASKVSSIYGSIDEEKWAAAKQAITHREPGADLAFSFGALKSKRYFLYVGGDDWRKNLTGLIKAYALYKRSLKNDPLDPLVITCSMTRERIQSFYDLAATLGLTPKQDIWITGHLPDQELIHLLSNALATLFPSLYEGLGLPILESYECDTPVLASNSSSMRELAPPSCLFEPTSLVDMASKIREFKRNPGIATESIEFGKSILKKYRWKESSRLLSQHLVSGRRVTQRPSARVPVSAVFGCLPPSQSGVAIFTLKTLSTAPWDVHFYSESENYAAMKALQSNLEPGHRVFHPKSFNLMRNVFDYSKAVFIFGNSDHHYSTLQAFLGLQNDPIEKQLYLHEAQLVGLWWRYFNHDFNALKAFFQFYYPEKKEPLHYACTLHALVDTRCFGIRPLVKLGLIKHVIVNSSYCKQLVLEDLASITTGEGEPLKVEIAFHPIFKSTANTTAPAAKAVQSPEAARPLTIGHFGILGPQKQPELLIRACEILAKTQPVKLVLAGFQLREAVMTYGLDRYPFIERVDSPDEPTLLETMRNVDVAVQLRWPTHGESSGCIHQLLDLGQKVIVTGVGTFLEYGEAVEYVSPEVTPDELARTIQALHGKNMAAAIRAVQERFSLPKYHHRMAEILDLQPLPQNQPGMTP